MSVGRRHFLKLTALSVAVLALRPGWVFAATPEPTTFRLPDLRRKPMPEFMAFSEDWHSYWLIRARTTVEFPQEPIGSLTIGMCHRPSGVRPGEFGDGEYLYPDGRELKIADFPELCRVLREHPAGIES